MKNINIFYIQKQSVLLKNFKIKAKEINLSVMKDSLSFKVFHHLNPEMNKLFPKFGQVWSRKTELLFLS